MKSLLLVVLGISACGAVLFGRNGNLRCGSDPNWKCNCEVVYNCGDPKGFPEDGAADSGILKDLAPSAHKIRVKGKRLRENFDKQLDFCEKECRARLQAFLDFAPDGSPSVYTQGGLCAKMFSEGNVAVDGSDVPCCQFFLRYGLDWCLEKFTEPIVDLYCFTRDTSGLVSGNDNDVEFAFSVEMCDAETDGPTYDWCSSDLSCTAPPSQ